MVWALGQNMGFRNNGRYVGYGRDVAVQRLYGFIAILE
jgi:hypothetical protein